MTTTAVCQNIRFTVSAAVFEQVLRRDLAEHPDIVFLQEAGPDRDHIIERVTADLGYKWTRATGGEPVLWNAARFSLRYCKGVRLARAELVGHLPGRKDRLPENIATEVGLDDLAAKNPDGQVVVAIDFHLTAEVQMGAGYRKDAKHLLRVLRHKREKMRLGHRGRMHERRGHRTFLGGDGNFAGMVIGRFVNCWENRHGGTLGGRAVDIVFAAVGPRDLRTLDTAHPHPGPNEIDHDGLVVVYA
jgi:hypothetical protein